MTGHGDEQDLNFEEIMRTLASLPQAAIPSAPPQQQLYDSNQLPIQADSLPATHRPLQPGILYGHEQLPDPRRNARPVLPNRQQTSSSRKSTPTIDPASITEWKHGLRCVNKLATQNPDFVSSIQKLMQDQERNVKDWEAGRQRLIEDQTAKRENEKTHLAALSLPGLLANTVPLRTPEREKEELDQYHQKVYRACQQMVKLQSTHLKTLGVPFFGIKPHLMLPDGAESTGQTEPMGQGEDTKITKKQLLELQRKMLNHLMEMYGD